MKKLLLNPGFECVFALSLIAIVGLPPLVFAQDVKEDVVKKEVQIKITNSDTVVNGKNIKELKGKERDEALSHFGGPDDVLFGNNPVDGKHRIIIKRKGPHGKPGDEKDIMFKKRGDGSGEFHVFGDVDGGPHVFTNVEPFDKEMRLNIRKFRDQPAEMGFDYDLDDAGIVAPEARVRQFRLRAPMDGFDAPNSQSFNYVSTDDEGISTHFSYRVMDVRKERLKELAGVEKADLALTDIKLSPEFSTGKTSLSFNLSAKTAADVQLKDSQGKVFWADKAAAGTFSKTFSLGLNGAYYLHVKQGASVAVKRIVKED